MAAKVMKEENVPVNDLYALMAPKLDLARGDQFQWKPKASTIQGKVVAAIIGKHLAGKNTRTTR